HRRHREFAPILTVDPGASAIARSMPAGGSRAERSVRRQLALAEPLAVAMPRAKAPAGWATFGFHKHLNEAMADALDSMLVLMGELRGLGRKEAPAMQTLGSGRTGILSGPGALSWGPASRDSSAARRPARRACWPS